MDNPHTLELMLQHAHKTAKGTMNVAKTNLMRNRNIKILKVYGKPVKYVDIYYFNNFPLQRL